MSTDREWLLKMAAKEDGMYVGAGLEVHEFEPVGLDYPDTCRLCACFRDSANHLQRCHRCGAEGEHGDSWSTCVHMAFVKGAEHGERRLYQEKEPCGHTKNFLIGDDYGHFTCLVCRCHHLQVESASWRAEVHKLTEQLHRQHVEINRLSKGSHQ